MMGFWIAAGLLLALAMLFLLPPLLRPSKPKSVLRRSDLNISVYKDQLHELSNDLANGTISQEQFDQAREDLERGLLSDTAVPEETIREMKPQAGRYSAIAVVIAVPLLAIGMYSMIGGGAAALHPEQAAPEVVTEDHMKTIEGMVKQLEARLETEPDNIDGWFMLGRSYQFLHRYQDAKAAFEKVMALGGGNNPDFLATYADVLAMADERQLGGEAMKMIQRALQLNPFHVKALWLAGTAAYQAQDFANALKYWERLAKVLPPGSEDESAIRANIAEVRSAMGLPPEAPAAVASAAASGSVKLAGQVELDKGLLSKAGPNDTVFIFARATEGPRMPLAILRKQVKDLPANFVLDDSMAMNPMMKLSNFSRVVVGARISKTGNAMPQPGDLQGFSQALDVADKKSIHVVINEVVE